MTIKSNVDTDFPSEKVSKYKIFLGGLGNLTEERVYNYFNQYGKIAGIYLMKDKLTGKSRGFGFINFTNKQTVDKILLTSSHIIEGRKVECKWSFPKGDKNEENNETSSCLIVKSSHFNEEKREEESMFDVNLNIKIEMKSYMNYKLNNNHINEYLKMERLDKLIPESSSILYYKDSLYLNKISKQERSNGVYFSPFSN